MSRFSLFNGQPILGLAGAALAISSLFTANAKAVPAPTYNLGFKIYHNLDHDGIYITRKLTDPNCIVDVIFKPEKFLKNVNDLQSGGMIDIIPDRKYEDIKYYLMQNASEHLAPLIIKMIFSEINPNNCSFAFMYMSKGSQGKSTSTVFNSFVMLKYVYEHIDWNKFSYYDLPSAVSLYYTPDWFEQIILQEQQGFWK